MRYFGMERGREMGEEEKVRYSRRRGERGGTVDGRERESSLVK
jgi:hypothetical protein